MSDFMSTLSSITKSVKDNLNTYEIRKVTEKLGDMVMNYSEAEMSVRNATNEDPWGPTGPELKEISHLTYQYDTFPQVMGMLWKRMFEDNRAAWRRVYKSLMVLNHLMLHGSERVIGHAKDHMYQLRQLEHYNHIDEKGKDQGVNIRHRTKLLLEMLQDEEKLRFERKKAKGDNKEKYQGFSKHEMSMGGGGNFSRTSQGQNFRDRDRDRDEDGYRDESNDYYDKDPRSEREREVSSFQFPNSARRNSLSPELGFRRDERADHAEEAEEDDFGDFASARNNSTSTATPVKTPQVQTSHLQRVTVNTFPTAPAIAPPTTVQKPASNAAPAANNTSAAFDLLGIDSPAPAVSSPQPDFFASAPSSLPISAPPPRPPSGGPVSPPGVALVDTIFSPSVARSPIQAHGFEASWASTPSPPLATLSPISPNGVGGGGSGFADFANFSSAPAPAPSLVPTTTTAFAPIVAPQQDALFDLLAPIPASTTTLAATPAAPTPSSSTLQSQTTPKKDTKIGSTWAGASGLINLDNLGKSPQVKASPSLNQMQSRPTGGAPAASSNLPW